MYSNFFYSREDMKAGIKILRNVRWSMLQSYNFKEVDSPYICDCIMLLGNRFNSSAVYSLKNWIREQIDHKFSYGAWLYDNYYSDIKAQKIADRIEVDNHSKAKKARILWINHMIFVLEEYLEENQ